MDAGPPMAMPRFFLKAVNARGDKNIWDNKVDVPFHD